MSISESLRSVPTGFLVFVAVVLLACVASATTVEVRLRMANREIPSDSDDHDRAWATYQTIRKINGVTIAISGLTAGGLLAGSLLARRSNRPERRT